VERVRDVKERSAQTSGQKISSWRTAKSIAANVTTERNAHSQYQEMRRLLVIMRERVSAGSTAMGTFKLELEEVAWLESSCPHGYKLYALPYLDGLNCETRGIVSNTSLHELGVTDWAFECFGLEVT